MKLQLKSGRMIPSRPRMDIGKLKNQRVAEEFANRLSGDLGRLDAFEKPEELDVLDDYKTTVLDVASGCLGTHQRVEEFCLTMDTGYH